MFFFIYLFLPPFQPQNILLTSAQPLGDIRIVDFGLSRRVDNTSEVREILGTPEYVGESLGVYQLRLCVRLNEGQKEVQIKSVVLDWSIKLHCST